MAWKKRIFVSEYGVKLPSETKIKRSCTISPPLGYGFGGNPIAESALPGLALTPGHGDAGSGAEFRRSPHFSIPFHFVKEDRPDVME